MFINKCFCLCCGKELIENQLYELSFFDIIGGPSSDGGFIFETLKNLSGYNKYGICCNCENINEKERLSRIEITINRKKLGGCLRKIIND